MDSSQPGAQRAAAPHDDAPSVIRSEERLAVETETFARERIHLQKYVVTEERTVTVTVRREELRVTREPVTGGQPLGKHAAGAAGTDQLHDADRELVIVLHEERPRVVTDVVPVERVTVRTHRVTEQQTFDAALRKERVELEVENAAPDVG